MSLDMLWAQVEECILNKTKVCWLIGALSDKNGQLHTLQGSAPPEILGMSYLVACLDKLARANWPTY